MTSLTTPTASNVPAAGADASPASAPHAPLVQRLARDFGAPWVDAHSVADWAAGPGHRVLLLAGDPVRFPEGLDVAAVLPELMKAFGQCFGVAVVPRVHEDAVARRYGAQRWPTLLFFRDGQYTTALPGMQDWDVYLHQVAQALASAPSRPPTIGVPLVAHSPASGCH